MVQAAETNFGKLNVLFNNAGIMLSQDDDAINTEEAIWDLTMAVNLKGVYLGCKYGIPALRRAGGGSIINTASFVALLGAATPQLAYTASKGGVLSMTRELAVIHARGKYPRERPLPWAPAHGTADEVSQYGGETAAPARAHPHGTFRRGQGDGLCRALPGIR